MTGDTEKGKSIRVSKSCFPLKSNLVIAQAAAIPKIKLSGTEIKAAITVNLMAANASALLIAFK